MTAVARLEDKVVVALEAVTQQPHAYVTTIGSGAGPIAFPAKVTTLLPKRKIADPLVLQDDLGRRSEELRRMRHISRAATAGSAEAWTMRISSIFDWPHADSKRPVLAVPCMMVGEQAEPVEVDLSVLPLDVSLGAHRLRVLRMGPSPENESRTRIVFQFFEPVGPRHFLGPGRLLARGMPADMSLRSVPDEQQLMWMDVIIPGAPIITIADGLVRIDGPWTIPLSLE